MIKVGVVTGREIRKNRDAEGDSLLLKAQLSSAEDIQTVELVSASGEQYIPRDGDILFIAEISPNWKIVIASSDGLAPDETMDGGDRKLYSLNANNEIMACIRFKNDGTLVLNEGEDWAVQFTALKEAFDQLKSDFNSMVSTWNTFAGSYLPGGPSTQGTPPTANTASSSSADMSGAKIESIQVP